MRRNSFYEAPANRPKPAGLGISGKDLSKKQERRVAQKSSGRCTPASGALTCAKGDVSAGVNLFECKTTAKRSLRVDQAWLAKIAREARVAHKEAGLVISFSGMVSDVDQDWIMIPFARFRELTGTMGTLE